MTSTAEEARQRLAGHTIWLWHYLHADWQWEQSREWHEERYALAVNEVLDLMREDDELTYFFDSTSEFLEPVVRLLGPRMEEVRQRVREGRIRIVSGQVANARPNQVGEETYLRNLQIGRREMAELFEGAPLTLFHSVDIAIGHSQMPQILQQAGFDRYRAWRPHGPMNALGIPHQFVWEGMDGSRVLVTRGAYGGFYLKEHVPQGFTEDWDGAVETLYDALLRDQLEDGRSESKQLWIIQGCDDARPYRAWHGDLPVDMPGFVAEWRQREEVPLKWCTPVEFTGAVAEHREALPVVRGVLDGADCSYNASNSGANGLWAWRLFNDRRLLRAERWAAIAALAGTPAPEADLTALWRQHLVYQAHAEDYAFAKDFDHLVDLARDVKFRAEKIEKDSLRTIAQAAGGGDRLTRQVFNPHPWPVEVDLDLYHACAVAGVEALEVVDEAGNRLPQQQISQFRHPRYAGSVNDQDHLVRLELPALGYRTIRIIELPEAAPPAPEPPADGVLETGALRLVFRDHALREVTDRTSGHTYRAPGGEAVPAPTLHLLDNQNWLSMGPELGRETFQAERSEWRETGPLRWTHRGQGRLGPYAAVVDTSVADRGREVRVKVRLEGHWAVPPVTGFVSLLTPVGTGGEMTVDVPFGVEARDPDHDVYSGSEPHETMFERLRPGYFWARSWADWSAADHGLTTIGADGNFFWQKDADRYGPVLIRMLKFVPGSWEEQCAPVMTGSGVHEFTYALRFHDGEWRAADPQRRATELHLPVRVVRADFASEATLPATHGFVEVAGPAMASAVYVEDGQQIVRLYEHEGTGGTVTVTLDRAPADVTAIDLLGRAVDVPVSVAGNTITVELRPWRIATLRFRPGRDA